MSWQLVAGNAVYILNKWDELPWEARWAMRMYLIEYANVYCGAAEETGVTRAVNRMTKMLEECCPDKNVVFCFYCGRVEFSDKKPDQKYEDKIPPGWSYEPWHHFSGFLCPRCEKHEEISRIFHEKDSHYKTAAKMISEFGAYALPELKEENKTWETREEELNLYWKCVDKVKGWIKQIYGDKSIYSAAPETLD